MKIFCARFRIFATISIFLFFVISCASSPPVHKSLDEQLYNYASNVEVLSIIPNHTINVRVDQLNYTPTPTYTGGLVGLGLDLIEAGIVKSIKNSRESDAKEIQEKFDKKVSQIDFRNLFWSKLETFLLANESLQVKTIIKSNRFLTEDDSSMLKTPLLLLKTFYEMSYDGSVMIIQTKAMMYINNLAEPDYFGFYTYYSDTIKKYCDPTGQVPEIWFEDECSLYRKYLEKGIEENILMMRKDLIDPLNNIQPKIDYPIVKITFTCPLANDEKNFQGQILEQDSEKVLFREGGGNLFSISKSLVQY